MSRLCCIVVACSFLLSCENHENKAFVYEVFEGDWRIVKATRDGEVNMLLKDGVFTFHEDSTLTTNIPTILSLGKVNFGKEVFHVDHDIVNTFQYTFNIEDSSLQLRTEIRGSTYQLTLEK